MQTHSVITTTKSHTINQLQLFNNTQPAKHCAMVSYTMVKLMSTIPHDALQNLQETWLSLTGRDQHRVRIVSDIIASLSAKIVEFTHYAVICHAMTSAIMHSHYIAESCRHRLSF